MQGSSGALCSPVKGAEKSPKPLCEQSIVSVTKPVAQGSERGGVCRGMHAQLLRQLGATCRGSIEGSVFLHVFVAGVWVGGLSGCFQMNHLKRW